MFLEYFDNLREKPKDVRKRYALFFTCILTGLIVLIWVGSILISNYGSRSPDSGTVTVDTDGNGQVTDTTTLFNSSNTFMEDGGADFSEQNNWEMELQTSLLNESKLEDVYASSSQATPESYGTSTGTSSVDTL